MKTNITTTNGQDMDSVGYGTYDATGKKDQTLNSVFLIFTICISLKLLLTVIGDVFFEDNFKFSKYNVTELELIIIFLSSDSPVT